MLLLDSDCEGHGHGHGLLLLEGCSRQEQPPRAPLGCWKKLRAWAWRKTRTRTGTGTGTAGTTLLVVSGRGIRRSGRLLLTGRRLLKAGFWGGRRRQPCRTTPLFDLTWCWCVLKGWEGFT